MVNGPLFGVCVIFPSQFLERTKQALERTRWSETVETPWKAFKVPNLPFPFWPIFNFKTYLVYQLNMQPGKSLF